MRITSATRSVEQIGLVKFDFLGLTTLTILDWTLRFIRRLERVVRERGPTAESVIDQYRRPVEPMRDCHGEPSKRHADLIVPEGGANRPALAVLRGCVRDVVWNAPARVCMPAPSATGRRVSRQGDDGFAVPEAGAA